MRADNNPFAGRIVSDRYKLISPLGQGGFGFVYKAEHVDLGKPFAIKFLHKQHELDSEFLERFKREARVTSQLEHPHIVGVSDYGSDPMLGHFFVMDFLQGEELADYIDREGALPSNTAVGMMLEITDGFAFAHSRGVVHRDVKTANIFLMSSTAVERYIKILDFGIARITDSSGKDQAHALTKTGNVMGSVSYMSPEQALARPVDHRTDIYSLGVVFYEMVTGNVPFQADSALEVLSMQIQQEPIPPSELHDNVDVHPYLEMIILKCLQKSPDHRYATVEELREDLTQAEEAITTGNAIPLDVINTTRRLRKQIEEEAHFLGNAKAAGRADLIDDRMASLPIDESILRAAGDKSRHGLAIVLGLVVLLVLGLVGGGAFLFGSRGNGKDLGSGDGSGAISAAEASMGKAAPSKKPDLPEKVALLDKPAPSKPTAAAVVEVSVEETKTEEAPPAQPQVHVFFLASKPLGAELHWRGAKESLGKTPVRLEVSPEDEGRVLELSLKDYKKGIHVLDLDRVKKDGQAVVMLEKAKRRKAKPRPKASLSSKPAPSKPKPVKAAPVKPKTDDKWDEL